MMKKNSSYMEVDGLGEVPLKSIRKQGGLKRKIVELVNHMPAPHRECETTDFLMALQHVLDEHYNPEIRQLSKALGLAKAVIATEEVMAGIDTAPLIKMINHIATEGTDSLGDVDKEFYEKMIKRE